MAGIPWSKQEIELFYFLKVELDLANWVVAKLLSRSIYAIDEKCKQWHVKRRAERLHTLATGQRRRVAKPPVKAFGADPSRIVRCGVGTRAGPFHVGGRPAQHSGD